MRTILSAIAALAIVIPAASFAQGRDHRFDGDRGGPMFHYHGHDYHAIHGPAFHFPDGQHYRHWSIGARLPAFFLSAPYFFTAYAALGIPPPAPGHRWVRNGPDLLMVNIYSGEVDDVIYNAFY